MGKHFTESEKDFIISNVADMTDDEIAQSLNVTCERIKKFRKRIGIKKSGGRGGSNLLISTGHAPLDKIKAALSEKDHRYWTSQLLKSARGQRIKVLLPSYEWKIFLDEWCAFHIQFDNLTFTEETTIEHLIYLRLRILRNQEELNKVISKRQLIEISEDQAKNVSDDNELDSDDITEQELHRMTVKTHLEGQINDLNKQYIELLDKANKLFQSLSGTREQREKQGKVSRETFFELCEKYKNKQVRDREGRLAELLKIATEKNMNKLREATEYMDGEIAPQLFDSETLEQMDNQQEEKQPKVSNDD